MERTVYLNALPSYDQPLVEREIEAIFQALPAAQRLVPGVKVLLKPNLLAKHPPQKAVTTHPAILREVIRACKRRGVEAENITVADSSGGVYTPAAMKAIYQTSGLWEVCQQEGVECYIGCRYGSRSTQGKLVRSFNLIQPVLDAEFIIDLPKLKTHVMTGYTGAVKNLFGCIPGLQKAELHMRFPQKEQFGQMLVDLLETVKPDMAILDGVLSLEGDGPAGGIPRQTGLILAGEDLPNLDLAACGLIGLDPMAVPYLAAARESGLCAKVFDPVDLIGDPALYHPIPGYKLPSSYTGGKGANFDFADHQAVPGFVREWIRKAEQRLAPRPVIDQTKCIGCGKCAEICPGHTIQLKKTAAIDPKGCIRCFCCHEMCPVKAIDVKQFRLLKL